MHDLCIFWVFCSKNHFWPKLFSYCLDKFDYPGSIVYLSCLFTNCSMLADWATSYTLSLGSEDGNQGGQSKQICHQPCGIDKHKAITMESPKKDTIENNSIQSFLVKGSPAVNEKLPL